MKHEIPQEAINSLSDALNLQSDLHTAEALARIATVNEPKLNKEWTVAKAVGKEILKRKWMKHIQKKYPYSDEVLLSMWDEFMDKGLSAAQAILSSLDLSSPDNIEVNYWGKTEDNDIAAMGTASDGTHTLYLYPLSLVTFFLRYIGAKHERDKVFVSKDFESVLAHEFYHMFQDREFPHAVKREKKKDYWDRRYEYGARLYSLRWLRQQEPHTPAERLGLWLARADVMISQLSNQVHVRDEINNIFGVKKPGLFHHVRMILCEYKKDA